MGQTTKDENGRGKERESVREMKYGLKGRRQAWLKSQRRKEEERERREKNESIQQHRRGRYERLAERGRKE